MFIELIDGLRCTADHADICLVAAIVQRDDRRVIEGTLGCPTCRQEYPVRQGVAWFSNVQADVASGAPHTLPDDDGPMRIGAFLSASEGATVALVGDWARYASGLAEMVGLRAFAVNPQEPITESDSVGVLYSGNRLPFKPGSLRGVAIDGPEWSADDIERAVKVLSAGGRMVAPATAPVPAEVEEIARDETVWVGEKRSALVALHRR
jgi:uncharacterized protein YbaR (Trm112 family)